MGRIEIVRKEGKGVLGEEDPSLRVGMSSEHRSLVWRGRRWRGGRKGGAERTERDFQRMRSLGLIPQWGTMVVLRKVVKRLV